MNAPNIDLETALQQLHMRLAVSAVLMFLVGCVVFVFCVIMFFDIVTTSRFRGFERFLWVLVLFGFPGVGALVYFVCEWRKGPAPEPQYMPPSVPDPAYFHRVQERLNKAKEEGYGGRAGA